MLFNQNTCCLWLTNSNLVCMSFKFLDGKFRRLFHKHASSRRTHSSAFPQDILEHQSAGKHIRFECILPQANVSSCKTYLP